MHLPKFCAFVCPHCEVYKAYPYKLGTIDGILCAGPASEFENSLKGPLCGKFTSALEVNSYLAMQIVEE
jgi:hypothetical protein